MNCDRRIRYPKSGCRTCATLHQLCEELGTAIGKMNPGERATDIPEEPKL
jgi:hypothetical protein